MSAPRPPRVAEALLSRFITNPKALEGLAGDLNEEFEERWRVNRLSARLHYWRAVLSLGLSYGGERRARNRSASRAPRRGESSMQTILQDLRFAGRTLAKSYGFTAVAVLTLAFGIGSTTAMFSLMDAAFLQPLPYAEPERLVLGRATFGGRINPPMSAYDFFDYREQAAGLESFSAFTSFTRAFTLTGFDDAERVDGVYASGDLFRTLGVDPQAGRHLSAEEGTSGGPAVVTISDRLARRHYGSPQDAVGETMRVDGAPATIVGVMPADFHFVFDVDLWMPMRRDGPFAGARRFHNFLAVGRLAAGTTHAVAQSEVDAISTQLQNEYPESNQNKALLLTPLHEALLESQGTSLWVLMAAVSLLLLIACGNVANLMLARGSTRRAELAVRAAMGASRPRLVRLLLTESLLIALISTLAGLFVAYWLQALVLEFLPLSTLGVDALGMSLTVVSFAVLTAVGTTLLFGTIPAIQGAPANVSQHLRDAGRSVDARRGAGLRGSLVVLQVAVSVVLLVGSGLMIRSLSVLSQVDPGFATEGVMTVEFTLSESDYPTAESVRVFYSQLLGDVRALPSTRSAALISKLPIRSPGNNITVYDADNPPDGAGGGMMAYTRNVAPGYFEALEIPLIAGRGVGADDSAGSTPVVVVSEMLAQQLFPRSGREGALGRRIVVDAGEPLTAEIVGVVGGVRLNGIQGGIGPTMYFPFEQMTSRSMGLAVRTAGDLAATVAAVRDTVRRLDGSLPLNDIVTMESLIAESTSRTRVIAASLSLFAGIALTLAVVGLYGVLAYYVAQRRREIGLRLAIGAQQGRILTWVLVKGLALVAIGLVLGVSAAAAATSWLQGLLYGVGGTDPLTFVAVGGLFLVVSLLACLVPALRATKVDPMVALSSD